MKRKNVIIALFAALFIIAASSCNRKTCPAYNKAAITSAFFKAV